MKAKNCQMVLDSWRSPISKNSKQQNSLLVVLCCCFAPQIVLRGLCSAVMRSTQMGAATRPRPSLRMLRCACPMLDDSLMSFNVVFDRCLM